MGRVRELKVRFYCTYPGPGDCVRTSEWKYVCLFDAGSLEERGYLHMAPCPYLRIVAEPVRTIAHGVRCPRCNGEVRCLPHLLERAREGEEHG